MATATLLAVVVYATGAATGALLALIWVGVLRWPWGRAVDHLERRWRSRR